MSELADKLNTAGRNGYSRRPGDSQIDSSINSLEDKADQKAFRDAVADFNVERGCFRVSGPVLRSIFAEAGFDISVSCIADYRRKREFRAKALEKAASDE